MNVVEMWLCHKYFLFDKIYIATDIVVNNSISYSQNIVIHLYVKYKTIALRIAVTVMDLTFLRLATGILCLVNVSSISLTS